MATVSPKNSSVSGKPNRKAGGNARVARLRLREYGSAASGPSAAASTRAAMSTVRAKMETQSTLCAAGTTPRALINPLEGLSPTMLLSPAGTRPEPAVSVPSAKSTWPVATT